MALIVENGEGLSNAESYCSVADADAYHAARGTTLWATMSTTEKEWSLRRATDFMLQTYGRRWTGGRATGTQSLDWPRLGVVIGGYAVANNLVPVAIRNACAELAFRAAGGELTNEVSSGIIEKKLGPATFKYSTAQRSNPAATADLMLAAFMAGRGFGQVFAERA